MNQAELVKKVAEQTNMTQVSVKKMMETMTSVMIDALNSNEDVKLSGLGKFSSHKVEKTTARNPRTGEPVEVPPHTRIKFRAFKSLKSSVN